MTIAQEFTSRFASISQMADDALDQNLPLAGTAFQALPAAFFSELQDQIANALEGLGDDPDAIAQALNDIPGDLVTASVVGGVVTIAINATDNATLTSQNLDLDLGVSALALDLEANATFTPTLSSALNLVLAYDTTAATPALTLVDGDDALKFGLDVAVAASGSAALGPIDITVTDNNTNTPEIALDLTVDITGNFAGVTVTPEGSVHLDLGLQTTMADFLPSITADLVLDWDLSAGMTVTPTVTFDNIALSVQGLLDQLTKVLEPVLEPFQEFPLKDIMDALTAEVPEPFASVIDFAADIDTVPGGGDGSVNLLDFIGKYLQINFGVDSPQFKALSTFAEAIAILNQLANGPDGSVAGTIELGGFTYDPTTGAATFIDNDPNSTPFEIFDQIVEAAKVFDDVVSEIGGLFKEGQTSVAGQGLSGATGLAFPILDTPDSIIDLFLPSYKAGNPILISYDLPPLGPPQATVGPFFFPVLGPIGISLGGSFQAAIDFAIAYDTKGLETGNPLDGIFLTNQDGAPAAFANANIRAGAGVQVPGFGAFVEGGLLGEIKGFFPNGQVADAAPPELRGESLLNGCIFDPLTGRIAADLSARITVGFGFFSWTYRETLAEVTLVEFSFGCDGDPILNTDPGRGLASIDPANSANLILHVGTLATARSINGDDGADVIDPATGKGETFRVSNALDPNGNLIAGALTVSAFGIHEPYGSTAAPLSIIRANFNNGHDTLIIDPDVAQSADVDMGAGNDAAFGGLGGDTIRGGADFDHLVGGGGVDLLVGGTEGDKLEGGEGADTLDGGDGIDQVTYEHSAVGVYFNKEATDGTGAIVGEGGEAEGDRLISIEYIVGSNFSDILWGTGGNDTLEGRTGGDALKGGNGNDYLLGGEGGDTIDGDDGTDATSYLTSYGEVRVDLLTGFADGGDATGDILLEMEDVQGTMFHDELRGNHSSNRLDGWYGDDILEGRGGADILTGFDGNDIIYAGADGDELSGGNGNRDLLSYLGVSTGVAVNLKTGDGGGVDRIGERTNPADPNSFDPDDDNVSSFENLQGSQFGDGLTGDNSNLGNIIWGMGGNDVIDAADGDDTLFGGAGGDSLTGGDGEDWADYSDALEGVTANFMTGGTRGDALGDSYNTIENLRGTAFADVLTGNDSDNIIDPGVYRSFADPQSPVIDEVFGENGTDTLWLDYTRGDYWSGVRGGFDQGQTISGEFRRDLLDGSDTVDGVDFTGIQKLFVIGTFKGDEIYGGGDADEIRVGGGDDIVFAGMGDDTVDAEDGDDTVLHGTGSNRLLSANAGGDDFSLNGGAGIDRLSLSLPQETGNITVTGHSADAEFLGSNLTGAAGSARNFELIEDVITGFGKDQVTQLGQVDNFIDTGWDVDIIKNGLGVDTIYGGSDFDEGVEGQLREITLSGEAGEEVTITAFVVTNTLYEANPGDLLELDYSDYAGPGGITGSVTRVAPDVPVVSDTPAGRWMDIYLTNAGTYASGDPSSTHLTFKEIERLKVTGSAGDDVLVGTFDPANAATRGLASSHLVTVRGDDTLSGGSGNDVLIGNTGDDTLNGGAGNDIICGEQNPELSSAGSKSTTVDTLFGDSGADLFVLGVGATKFYTAGSSNDTLADHASIKDFDASEGDRIQLSGAAGDYRLETDGTSTLVLLAPLGVDNVIAKLENVTNFDLNGSYVDYVGAGDPFPTPPAGLMAVASAAEDDEPPTALAAASGPSTLATGWVTQTNDRQTLLNTLLGSGNTGLKTLDVQLEGDGRAFGTFDGDPFGLGSGIILSTGKVDDVDQPNTTDGLFTGGVDLISDLGLPGDQGDTIRMTYTFEKEAGAAIDTLVFDFVMFSEEFREYGGSNFNDTFKIMLNGVNLATLSDGAAANINNLAPAQFGPFHPDLILNPAGTGPVADSFRADAYTKTLHYSGKLQDGINTLTIEVEDVHDGLWDSGILVKAGTMKGDASAGGLLIGDGKGGLGGGGGGGGDGGTPRLIEGGACIELPITVDPGLRGSLTHPLIITITPSADLDVGNGPGVAKVVTINPGDPLTFDLCVQARNDGQDDDGELGTVNVSVESDDPAYDGLPIAPFLFEIGDAFPTATLFADHKLNGATGLATLGDGVTIQGFDLNGNAAALAYGDGGVGVAGSQYGFKGEKVFNDEIDRRGGKSEKLVINFNQPASNISLTLGQLYANEKKLGELVEYTAYEEDGDVIATGTLDPNVDGTKISDAVWSFDLGLDGVAKLELSAADLYRGGKAGKLQSDFNLQSVTYAPSEATAAPDIRTAITGDNGKNTIDGTQAPHSQSFAGDGMELIAGLGGKDKLSGLGGNDILDGGKSKDKLRGGDGDDVLIGGSGKDVLTGEAGRDQFLFNTALAKNSADKITDFIVGEDAIVLDDAVFRKLDLGALTSSAFFLGKEAHDGDDRIIYNRKNGELIYDKNGDDKGGETVFAVLDKKLNLSEADFLVV